MRYFQMLIGGLLMALAVACSDCEPIPSSGNSLVVSFFDSVAYNANRQLTAKKTVYDSIFTLQNADTLPYSQLISRDTSVYRLPLPLLGDTVVYLLAYSDTVSGSDPVIFQPVYDTLAVGFDRVTLVSTPDCGVVENYENLRVGVPTSFEFELSINFIDPNVDQNISIFR